MLAFNFFTLAVMLFAQYKFWARERFVIEHLTDSPYVEGDFLPKEIVDYPAWNDRLEVRGLPAPPCALPACAPCCAGQQSGVGFEPRGSVGR